MPILRLAGGFVISPSSRRASPRGARRSAVRRSDGREERNAEIGLLTKITLQTPCSARDSISS